MIVLKFSLGKRERLLFILMSSSSSEVSQPLPRVLSLGVVTLAAVSVSPSDVSFQLFRYHVPSFICLICESGRCGSGTGSAIRALIWIQAFLLSIQIEDMLISNPR